MSDGTSLSLVLDQVSKDKNIERKVLVEALEQAILTAAKKAFGEDREMEATFNEATGRVDLSQIIVVADPVTMPAKEITLEEANRFNLQADVGDELLFQIFYDDKDQAKAEEQDGKYGALLKLNRAWKTFGRFAAQTAKQVILQRVREAERENVFNQYRDKKGELISGIVRRFERGNIVVDLGGPEAILPVREQVQRESYRAGDRIVAYVVEIDKSARGPQIIISRAHKGLLEKLFEMEVPEIYDKIVRVEASAREAGARSKIAVFSRDRDVDPVGACVGMKGSRVQAVVQELRGEKIDIVPYDADPARFVCNAIAPAEVSRVLIDAAGHTMQLIVPDDKLSLAIGKKGQNVRLASQLTGWRIDIHSESKVREMEERARVSHRRHSRRFSRVGRDALPRRLALCRRGGAIVRGRTGRDSRDWLDGSGGSNHRGRSASRRDGKGPHPGRARGSGSNCCRGCAGRGSFARRGTRVTLGKRHAQATRANVRWVQDGLPSVRLGLFDCTRGASSRGSSWAGAGSSGRGNGQTRAGRVGSPALPARRCQGHGAGISPTGRGFADRDSLGPDACRIRAVDQRAG
jgi:N utilization substance protein A